MTRKIMITALLSVVAIGLIGSVEASSLNGWTSYDRERVTFEGVNHTPIYIMSTSTIYIIQGQAIDQYVKVYFDNKLIETIDLGIMPDFTPHRQWVGFSDYVTIPFEAYYEITEDGKLLDKYRGNQNVSYDADGNKIYLDDEDNPIKTD